ncbi:MAG: lytic murein transglycosylase, partial [Parvularcula sp.]|nr:lytic murein transglycosylase [Parvularcula sp.]
MFAPILLLAAAITAGDAEFEAFKSRFRAEAIAKGVEASVYDREMASAAPLEIVFERDSNQPEFVRPIWGYLDSAVSDRRVADGRVGYEANQALLAMIAETYGVDPAIVVAIWGLESAYGKILGDHDVLSALSTLAYKGRRQSFGEQQLVAALTILQNGDAQRSELKGSWAGAMGQTQFIPTTYLAYAIDWNSDGRRDLWADREDVFASTANYLDQSGWVPGQPAVLEVTLPEQFNYAAADGSRRTVAAWMESGVKGAMMPLTDRVDAEAKAKLLLPAGAKGPAFLTFANFDAIKRYNNATSYALGVALLAERIKGADITVAADWPRDDRPLSFEERIALQEQLAARGYQPGPADGIIGPRTMSALREWQQTEGLPADGYPSAMVLSKLL